MNKISITIPMTVAALTSAANMFTDLAGDLVNTSEQPHDLDIDGDTTTTEEDNSVAPPPHNQQGVELDADGLPWDVRINPASRAKVKKTNLWKLKPRIDPELVKTVHTELREAMAATGEPVKEEIAPPPEEDNSAAPPPPPPPPPPPEEVKAVTLYETNNGNFSEADLLAAGWGQERIDKLPIAKTTITTFPELMKLITPAVDSGELEESDVIAAVNAVGLTALNLLAARPDLVQQVKDALF